MPGIIDCRIHGYIEVACLYGFQIKLELIDQPSIQGQAQTTETSADKREWLILEIEGQSQKIDLSTITSMLALTENPHFDKIDF